MPIAELQPQLETMRRKAFAAGYATAMKEVKDHASSATPSAGNGLMFSLNKDELTAASTHATDGSSAIGYSLRLLVACEASQRHRNRLSGPTPKCGGQWRRCSRQIYDMCQVPG